VPKRKYKVQNHQIRNTINEAKESNGISCGILQKKFASFSSILQKLPVFSALFSRQMK